MVLARAVDLALEVWISVSRLRRFAAMAITGRLDTEPKIEVPPDPKPLAAERALAEAEARRQNGS